MQEEVNVLTSTPSNGLEAKLTSAPTESEYGDEIVALLQVMKAVRARRSERERSLTIMIREGDPGRFTVWAKRDGVETIYSVCRTKEEARSAKDEYEAAGYQVEIIERIAGTTAKRIWRPQ
jgi:hypothetical protein